ncbi:MAG: MauE/DoxX family redox-associated membrane protein [Microthrixaceae bacterium]
MFAQALSMTFHAGAAVLVAAGYDKARRPAATAAMLLRWIPSLRRPQAMARLLSVGEVALGLAGLVVGSRWLALAAGAAFAVFAVQVEALRRQHATDCGCLGSASSPPDRLHAGMNALFALGCVGAAALPAGSASAVSVVEDEGLMSVPYLVGLLTVALLVLATLAVAIPTRHAISVNPDREAR